MKTFNIKKLAISAAIASVATLGVSAMAENTDVDQSQVQQVEEIQSTTYPETSSDPSFSESRSGNPGSSLPSNINTEDETVTNPNVEGYSDRSDMSGPDMEGTQDRVSGQPAIEQSQPASSSPSSSSQLAAQAESSIQFEPNSVSLTQQAERELERASQQLDKSKPVALIVAVDDAASAGSSSAGINQDSSAGYPAQDSVAGTGAGMGSDPAQTQQENRSQLVSMYRAENIRDYLEEKGFNVVQWNLESESTGAQNIGVSRLDNRADAQSQDVQQLRVVVSGEIATEGLSGAADFE
ncbi:hypothetical protein DWB84_09285 [Saccharophagus sp. K07]|uniref:hypothetical protein n=1 Tax=Saccharophagus sp. K07 TaxID=2283636 RepID=UPI0016529331|nr:hypothetical protein [Saccharophagus sp. K07]MBC6905647.1 hypothetical protein [Saccharophagus sp. K07]